MKWGIMATGSIAQKFASTVNRMTDEGEILQAVASRTKESAENFARQHRIPEVFDSYKAMAESDSVDVIYIATPNNCLLYTSFTDSDSAGFTGFKAACANAS